MIFTIGHQESYLEALKAKPVIPGKRLLKIGRRKDYPGGYAFKTREDAQRRIDEEYAGKGFAIFGLEADWQTDTVPSETGWWHALINDAAIILLE